MRGGRGLRAECAPSKDLLGCRAEGARAPKTARALSDRVVAALSSEYPQMLHFAGRWAALLIRGWDDIIYRQDDGRIRISLAGLATRENPRGSTKTNPRTTAKLGACTGPPPRTARPRPKKHKVDARSLPRRRLLLRLHPRHDAVELLRSCQFLGVAPARAVQDPREHL